MSNPQIVDIVRIHELTLPVIRHNGVDYVEAKRIIDYAGTDWRGARKVLQEPDHVNIYGVCHLKMPEFVVGGGASSPRNQEILCVRLDRVAIYLCRINVRHMRAQGNADAADRLVVKIKEWATALHEYETKGVAVKKSTLHELTALNKMRHMTTCPAERESLTTLIHQAYAEMGVPVPLPPQAELNYGAE